jgi:hypothetical protein
MLDFEHEFSLRSKVFGCSGVQVFGFDKGGPAVDVAGPEHLNT